MQHGCKLTKQHRKLSRECSGDTHKHQAGVHQTEGAWPADPCTTVYDGRTHVPVQGPWPPHLQQKVQESLGRLGHPKVWPCSVVELQNFFGLSALCRDKADITLYMGYHKEESKVWGHDLYVFFLKIYAWLFIVNALLPFLGWGMGWGCVVDFIALFLKTV